MFATLKNLLNCLGNPVDQRSAACREFDDRSERVASLSDIDIDPWLSQPTRHSLLLVLDRLRDCGVPLDREELAAANTISAILDQRGLRGNETAPQFDRLTDVIDVIVFG